MYKSTTHTSPLQDTTSLNFAIQRAVKSDSLDTLELTADFSDKSSQNKWRSRQNIKAISKSINGKLCYLNSPIHKDYQAAYYCTDYLLQDGSKILTKYCQKRNCPTCSRIKAAKYMAAYAAPLLELEDLHLVTLTTPNVKADQLYNELNLMYGAIRKISDNIRKNHKGIKLVGLRKLELTSNYRKYNPHFHLLLSTREVATLVLSKWLKHFPKAKLVAQDITKVKDSKALFEVFKYVTKAIVKDTFDTNAVDTMYQSVKGRRTIQPMGIKKVDTSLTKYETSTITHRSERVDVWKWCKDRNDWYSSDNEPFNDSEIESKTKRVIKVVNQVKQTNEYIEPEPYTNSKINQWRSRNRSKEIEWYD